MDKYTKKQNYNILMVDVLVICTIAVYTFFSQKQIEEYAQYIVEQSCEDFSEKMDMSVSSAINSIQQTSHLVSRTMSGTVLENANDVLDLFIEQSPFEFIEYIEQDSTNTTDKGEKFGAGDCVYYKEGIAGNTGVWINYHPKYSNEYLLNFYTPLYYQEQVVGVLTGAMGADTNVLPLMENNFLGEEMISILCDENGQIIASTVNTDGDTYLEDLLVKLGVTQETQQVFYNQLDKKNTTAFEFDSPKGESIACVGINERTGWKIVQIVPPTSLKAVMRSNTRVAYGGMIIISILLIFALHQIRFSAKRKHKEMLEEKNRMVQNYEQILTTTASDTYKGIRRIDLETANSEYIYFEDYRVKQVEVGDYTVWIESQQKYINPDDWERVRAFISIDNLRAMKEGVTCSENYRSASKNEAGYFRTYTTTVSVIRVEGKRTAIMSNIDNTAAVVSEMEQKRLLASAASIYVSMHVMDLKNDVLETLNCAEHISNIIGDRKQNVQAVLCETMSQLTDKQYLNAMMEFIDFSTLDERMKDSNTITMEFLGTMSGWCRARFIAVDYDENHRLNRVLWVVENIDAEKRKSNQLLYLSETDLMTGIRNRGSGERTIKELIASDHQGVFCVLDVDKFKAVNDNFGHGVGDKVLIAVAKCLKESFRETDVVMRLGGDEFAVFADGIVVQDIAATLIERFFDKIDHIDISELGDYNISVSLGAAIKIQEDGLDFEALYRNADLCTYESKKIQGNSYVFYGNETE